MPRLLVCGGGAAANGALREALARVAMDFGMEVLFPGLDVCTDNAEMIGAAAACRLAAGPREQMAEWEGDGWCHLPSSQRDDLWVLPSNVQLEPRALYGPRWPLGGTLPYYPPSAKYA